MKLPDPYAISNSVFAKIKIKIDNMDYKELSKYFSDNFTLYNDLQLLLNSLYDRENINAIFLCKVETDFLISKKVIFYASEKLDNMEKINE